MLVADQVKLYELGTSGSSVIFLTYALEEEGEEKPDLVVAIAPMGSSEDDDLNYVVHTLSLSDSTEMAATSHLVKQGFELRHVPASALHVYRLDNNWLNADVTIGELVESESTIKTAEVDVRQNSDKRSIFQSLTIQSLIVLLAFFAIKETDSYLSELVNIPHWAVFGRDILHKLMVDAGALITLGIFSAIGTAIFGRVRIGDLS
jgi:hypothetical protein